MKFIYKKAFTLIELLVAISIFFILVTLTYVPYNFYMNKVKVRNTIKEISQNLYEARNMAINGISDGSNKSIGLYIDIEDNDNILNFYSYPFSFTGSQIINEIGTDIELVKTYKLIEGIQIRSIDGHNNGLFFFDAITGNGKYYYWDNSGIRQDNLNTEIQVEFSFKNAIEGSPLYGKLKYFTKTNIVDY